MPAADAANDVSLVLPRRRRLVAAALLAALAAGGGGIGCSVLPSRPYIEARRFPLVPRRPAGGPRRGSAGRKVLLVRLMRAAPGLDQRGLRTRRADGSESLDFYNEWIAPPAELVEEALRRWLTDSGLFSAVTTPGSRAGADLVLEMELTALRADLASGTAVAELSGVLLSGGGGPQGGRVLAQLTPRGEVPLSAAEVAAGGAERDVAPEVAAEAMTNALAEALRALERSLARFA
jgi:cholesterol transport system auxiliary component